MSKLFFLKRWLVAPYKRYKTIQMLCPTYRHLVRYLWNFSCDKRIREKERAMLVFRCHAIEKGLSLKNARPGFGIEKMGQLISAVLNYIKHFKDDIEPISFALSIIDAYFEFQNRNGFEDEKLKKRPKEIKQQNISLITGSVTTIIIIALVSCKFLYGVLVIGSESMSGSIEKGDVIVFKSKKNNIKEGDVIVFKKGKIKVVHRVIAIKNVNNEFRYYTKGDANIMADEKYVTKSDLMGKVLIRIRYIGKPTLWLRQLFDKEG